jgi:hypothetical protein
MTKRLQPEIELGGWKAIAQHLGVSVREAQSWEKDAELPVRRLPGKKSRVWAYRSELDVWKEQMSISAASRKRALVGVGGDHGNAPERNFTPGRSSVGIAGSIAVADHPDTTPPDGSDKRVWRFSRHARIFAFVTIAVLVLGAAVAVFAYFRRVLQIVDATAIGNTLIAKGVTGNVLWSYQFDAPIREHPSKAPNWRTQVIDLNGDGKSEVLVAAEFSNPSELHGNAELFCFSSRGKLLWRYRPESQMEFNRRDLNGPWTFHGMLVVDDGKSKSVWLAVAHQIWWPAFLVKIRPDGGHEIMFTSSGTIYSLQSVRTKSGSYVLAGGINNEYRMASVAVLAVNGTPSTSPQGDGSQFQCLRGCPSGRPYRYILLPRSEVNAASDLPYNNVSNMNLGRHGVTIQTAELEAASQFFELSEEFQPEWLIFSSDYPEFHRRFEKEGRIDHSFDICPEPRHAAIVRIFDENGISRLLSVPRVR